MNIVFHPHAATARSRQMLRLSLIATLCLGSLAQAQSAYTLTTLKSPTTHGMRPTDMDNTGRVVGHTYDQVLVVAGSIVFGSPSLEYWPRIRAASWSATRSSTVTGVRGASRYGPIKTNQAGMTVGQTTKAASNDQDGYVTPAVEKGGKVTVLDKDKIFSDIFTRIGGINQQGQVVATVKFNRVPVGTPFAPSNHRDAVLLTTSGIMPLGREGHASATGRGINDLGQVVGSVLPNSGAIRAAIWVDGKITRLGEDFTEAIAINNAGHVLVVRNALSSKIDENGNSLIATPEGPRAGSAAIWLGSQTTPIGTEQQVVKPTSMNNSGTVVGCADGVSFIWKNGVMLDLLKEVTSKGVKLPAGAVIDCPVAINDAGSIVASMTYLVSSSGSFFNYKQEWIRLNAVP